MKYFELIDYETWSRTHVIGEDEFNNGFEGWASFKIEKEFLKELDDEYIRDDFVKDWGWVLAKYLPAGLEEFSDPELQGDVMFIGFVGEEV
jgi:hypothetical protein